MILMINFWFCVAWNSAIIANCRHEALWLQIFQVLEGLRLSGEV